MTEVGKVFKGQEFIADVCYDHRMVQNYTDGRHRIPTTKTVHLHITPSAPIGPSASLLTLHMSDGKKQDFLVVSSDGACKATGVPY